MVTIMKSLKKFIASLLVVLMMFVQIPFAAIAEEIENANSESQVQVNESNGNENNEEGEEGLTQNEIDEIDNQTNNQSNEDEDDNQSEMPMLRGASNGDRSASYGDGFKVAMRWAGTSNPNYTWNATTNEDRVIKLTFYYQNEVSPKAYAPGEIKVTIPGIGNLNRESTKKASDIAADVYGSAELKRDWSYKYNSANDTYTFYNNHAIEQGETFNGSFEILYEFNSRESVHEFEKTIQATLNDGERNIVSSDLNFEFTSKRDEFTIQKSVTALSSYDGLGSHLPEGKTARDYAWVRYSFSYNSTLYSRGLQSRYTTDTFPDGCIVITSAAVTTNPDGTKTCVSPNGASIIVGYPASMIGQTIENTGYLYGRYYEEDEDVLLDDSTVSIRLETIAPYTSGVLISKDISPDYVYKDSITNSLSFTATLRANIKTSSDHTGVYKVAITDDMLEMCSEDKTDSTKTVMKVLDDDEYTFTRIRVPGMSELKDGNGNELHEEDCNLRIYALYKSDVTEGDLSTRALSNYTQVFDGKWTSIGRIVDFNEDVLAVRAEISGLVENVPGFYITTSGIIKDLADSIEGEEYVNPKYIINHEFTEYEDDEGHSLINVSDYTRQDLYDRDVAIYGQGLARAYDTIVFRERQVDPGYYSAYADIKPFTVDESGIYFETELTHSTSMNNKDRSEISTVEVHGTTVKEELEQLIETIRPTYSGLTFKNSLPSDVNMEEYLMERATITKDGTEIKIVFDFSDNPITSRDFSIGYKVDARLSYEDYYVESSPSYTVRTYAYTPDGTMNPYSTATHEGKTMATDTDNENIILALASHQQLIKTVKTLYSGDFVEEDAVSPMNETYTYRLKLRNGYNTLLNTEFIDILEHAELAEVDGDYPYHESEWYGTFNSIDTSYMEGRGFTLRAYYANTLTPDENSWTLMESHQDGIWTTQNPVKAIKVCIDDEVPENSVIYVDVNMDAPYDTTLEDKKAYNAFLINGDAIDLYSGIRSSYMRNMPSNEIDVRLVEKTYDVYITKTDAVNGMKLQGVKFGIYNSQGEKIRSDYTGILGNIPFKNLKAGTYTIKEEETPLGYKTLNDYTLTINPDGTYSVTTIRGEDLDSFESTGEYAWTQNDDGVWQSNNYNMPSSTSTMTSSEFILQTAGTLSFDWSVSSQGSSSDYVTYTIRNAQTGAAVGSTGKIYGTSYGTAYENLTYVPVSRSLSAGTYTIEFTYRKNASTNTGLDRAFVKNIKYKDNSATTMDSGTSTVESNIPTIKFDIENQRAKGSIKVHKIDEYKNNEKQEIPLSNVNFNLKDQDGTVIKTGTTNAQGEITFSSLDWGKVYTVEESQALQGYELAVQNAYLSKSDKDTTVVVENKRKEGTITLTKEDEIDGTKIEGAKYGLYAKEDIYDKDGEKLYENDELIEEKITNSDGKITFENVIWGEYYIKETETVYGYDLSKTEYLFTMGVETVETEIQLIEKEKRSSAKLQLIKLNDKGSFLSGAKFKLYNEDGTEAEVREKVLVPNELNFSQVGDYGWIQNDDGVWQSDNYLINNSTATIESNEFTLSGTETLSFEWSVSSQGTSSDYLYYTIIDTETGEAVSGTGTSTKIGGTSYGTVYETLNYNTVSKELQPGKYKLKFSYYKNSSSYSGLDRGFVKNISINCDEKHEEDVRLIKEYTTNEQGQLNVEGIEWGTYYIQESEAAEGYELLDTKYHFTVDRDTFKNNNTTVTRVIEGDTTDETSTITNTQKLGKVTLTKYACDSAGQETTNVLPDAIYELYKSNGELVGEYTTNSEGQIVVENLDWNSYYFLEKEAPTGYSTSDKKLSFVINSKNVSFEHELTAYDKMESGEITINKVIPADSIYGPHGNSSFIFKIIGKDENDQTQITLYRTVTFTEDDKANEDVNGNLTKTIKISDMNPYKYEITEEENYRYELDSIIPVSTNASVDNTTGKINLLDSGLNKGEITFENEKQTNSLLTHNEVTTNSVQSEYYLIGFEAIPKEDEYLIGTVLTKDDFTYILYYSGGQEVEVETLENITINGESSYTQSLVGDDLLTLEYTEGGKAYSSDVLTKWIMPSDYFTYTMNSDGTITITGINTTYPSPETLYIPGEYNGYTVKQVGIGTVRQYSSDRTYEPFANATNVKSVIIGEGVSKIGKGAFYNKNISSVELPSTLEKIEEGAFKNCRQLTSVDLSDTSITELNGVDNLGSTTYAYGPFAGCVNLNEIILPETLEKIGEGTFAGCSKLKSIDIPNSVLSIEKGAFRSTGITSIDLSNTQISNIADNTFQDCISLTDIDLPNAVTIVGDQAFQNCSSLTSIDLPSGVTSIGKRAFSTCTSLVNIDLPDTVTSIGDAAFYQCSNLTNVNLSDTLISIGDSAFGACNALTSIDLPDTLTSIGDQAFWNCIGLTSIDLPDSLTSIGSSAFQSCTNITIVNIPQEVTSIGAGAFSGCSKLTSITVDSNNTCFSSEDGVLFNKNKTSLIAYPSGKEDVTSYTIPDSVTSIESYAFSFCIGLTSINISDTVTNIGDYAFNYCSGLTSIDIPDGITEIATGMFYNCSNIININLPDTVTNIGNHAFSGCSSLTSIDIPEGITRIEERVFYNCSSLTSIDIPEGVTSIGRNSFDGCIGLISIDLSNTQVSVIGIEAFTSTRFRTIYLPTSLTTVGNNAFYRSSVRDIYYVGTESQFNAIKVGSNNTSFTNATKHYNYDPNNP